MISRVIDLGCGMPRASFISSLPAHQLYIGVDTVDFSACPLFEPPQRMFVRSDGLRALAELRPSTGDLVVSTFAAHHIGVGALLMALGSLSNCGAEYIVVDAALMHRTSFSTHFARSVLACITGTPASSAANGQNAARLRRSQLRFLLTAYGLSHARADFRAGRQRPASAFESRVDSVSFASMWCLVDGKHARHWLQS